MPFGVAPADRVVYFYHLFRLRHKHRELPRLSFSVRNFSAVTEQLRVDRLPLYELLEHAFDAVALARPHPWRLVFVNPALAAWLQRQACEMVGEPLDGIFRATSTGQLWELIEQVWQGTATDRAVRVDLRDDLGRDVRVESRVCRIVLGDEPLIALTLRKLPAAAQGEVPRSERRDPLTELPDRSFLESRLAALLDGERSADRQFAVLFVDLDNFKQVNDAHGHLIGDRVLRECARRLAACVREGDHVTRFGGDEFVVLIAHVDGREEIDPVIQRIQLALAAPIALPGEEFTPAISIGVAIASPDHRSPDDLLHEADRAMYAAKRVRIY
jgi:diguanylate cyclase (GGDEF)-like protein